MNICASCWKSCGGMMLTLNDYPDQKFCSDECADEFVAKRPVNGKKKYNRGKK
jgi:hypothetical protein